jgi:hypothetical protein
MLCRSNGKSLDRPGNFAKSILGMGASRKRFGGSAFKRDSRVVDPRSFRLRNFLAIACAAVLTAAVLRHVLHVYGGISREDIRADALLATFIVAVATVFYQRVSRRR